MKTRLAALGVVVAMLSLHGCLNRSLRQLVPCTISGVIQNVPIERVDSVDLLFVIDNSRSMVEEQTKLRQQIPRLVDVLIDGDDLSNPGVIDPFPPVTSLRVGVITPDLGVLAPGGLCSITGDDGRLQNAGETCTTSSSSAIYYQFDDGMSVPMSDKELFKDDIDCVTDQGTDGCGFEQQLESTARSFENTANAGFVRSDALLAIILVTDEEDCSTDDPDVFDATDSPDNPLKGPYVNDTPGMNNIQRELRCFAHRQALYDVQRYVERLSELKADPENVVFAAIAGVPNAPIDPSDPLENADLDLDDFDAVLADGRMVQRPFSGDLSSHPLWDVEFVNSSGATRTAMADANTISENLVPVCQNDDGRAFPARRIVETAQGLQRAGVGTVVRSICDSDYTDALNNIIEKIGDALRNICLPNALNRDAEGFVSCEVVEVQADGVSCASVGRGRSEEAVRTEIASDGTMREVCAIEQLPSDGATEPSGLGWFYDDFSAAVSVCTYDTRQRVSFTDGAAPIAGTRVRFECLEEVTPDNIDVGTPCGTDATVCDGRTMDSLSDQYDRAGLQLFCEPQSNSCQLECTFDADCPGGYACFDPDPDDAANQAFCVKPNCTLS